MNTREHWEPRPTYFPTPGKPSAAGIHHIKGRPGLMVPSFIQNEKVDILVMGTVARTGIRAFVFGNTAENVVQNLPCSVMALKPNGFVSPVKAY